jgi:hypothetical protein
MRIRSQDEIDALVGGKTVRDWENRFEPAYQTCKDENVTLVGGVSPTAIGTEWRSVGALFLGVEAFFPQQLANKTKVTTCFLADIAYL